MLTKEELDRYNRQIILPVRRAGIVFPHDFIIRICYPIDYCCK